MDEKNEREGAFAIGIYSQELVEENARDAFGPKHGDPEDRKKAMRAGYVDAEGDITEKGWGVLNDDIAKLERNSLAWLRTKFNTVRDEGHDHYDDLVGTFWFDVRDPKQASLVELGVSERIDMTDASYGDLSGAVWKGTSPFAGVLGGQINFIVDSAVADEIEETVSRRVTRR